MDARSILTLLSIVFFVLAALRFVRDGGRLGPQSRTWLLISAIFAAVSTFLWLRG